VEEIKINIIIAERPYRLAVDPAEEEKVRRAASFVNDKINQYAKSYAFKDYQDLLAMAALQFATSTMQYESELTYSEQHLKQKLNDLDTLLSTQLENK
jgi:cell division protein ZapA